MSQEHLNVMASILAGKGITHIVASPGSRNAPVIIVLNQTSRFRLHSIADERSAGFYALGLAQQLGHTVALLCTSGSAALNYAPALAEAYYQKIPLLAITADRPLEWIDQGDGQTIRQTNVFSNYVRKSFSLPHSIGSPGNRWHFERMVNEAADRCLIPAPGPVHLNLPLAEPLYDLQPAAPGQKANIISLAGNKTLLSDSALEELAGIWNASTAKLILAGQLHPNNKLGKLLDKLAGDRTVAVFTESTSNLYRDGYTGCIDRTIEGLNENNFAEYRPGILLTFGGAIVSKKIKALLRKMKPHHHWHINSDPDDFHLDTYQSLSLTLPVLPQTFLEQITPRITVAGGSYAELWEKRNTLHLAKHKAFAGNTPYSDFRVFDTILSHLPAETHLHLGNSTPVRYAQLFEKASRLANWSNRGTSGIDGCVSTAVGAARLCPHPVTVITGDIGFFYDSNALWNTSLPGNLRIILINNGGGNIFRVIPGPDRYEELEEFIETKHQFTAEGIASAFGLRYYKACNLETLEKALNAIFTEQPDDGPVLLEVSTPAETSAGVLRDYFKFIAS